MKKLLWLALLLISRPALSDEKEGLLNKLLAPGKLLQGHEDLEKTGCLQCHTARRGTPDSKCLDCHKEIATFVKAKKGFHGRQEKQCFQCHSDHKGREFDSTLVDEKTFDHRQTGFSLEGKHSNLKCAECHTDSRKEKSIRSKDIRFLGATTTCESCHKKDDIHAFQGKLAEKDCNSCHSPKSWKDKVQFNHSKDTAYPLIGKHQNLKCQSCHNPTEKPSIYRWPKLSEEKCLSCHENVHAGRMNEKFLGPDCTGCHSSKLDTWKIKAFDHNKTNFVLKGAHAKLKCLDCHKQTPEALKIGSKAYQWISSQGDCVSCHEDVHKNNLTPRFQNACSKCHGLETWKIKAFDHKITGFELKDSHLKPKCIDCHKQTSEALASGPKNFNWTGAKSDCKSCHNDYHLYGSHRSKALALDRCENCHNEIRWEQTHDFAHNTQTRFAVDGRHTKLKCNDCHTQKDAEKNPSSGIYFWPELEQKPCETCHQSPHTSVFSEEAQKLSCLLCHTTNDWKTLAKNKFDHDQMTRFRLDGKHQEAKCMDCHLKDENQIFRFKAVTKNFCNECHENIHEEQFSAKFSEKACSDCHSTVNFSERSTMNHDETRYPLKDKHLEVRCNQCHTPTKKSFKKSLPQKFMAKFVFQEQELKTCLTCHSNDPHRGNYGKQCAECHSEKGWKLARDFHKNFTLTGVHYNLRCVECHKSGRRLTGLNNACMLCHQKDDIHGGGLPRCYECHRQDFWEKTSFSHAMTHFPLRGAHRTIDCSSCHGSGVYRGTQNQCVNCHLKDAQPVPRHQLAEFTVCSQCHNQFSFQK
jgi:hypothetical protein